MSTERGGRAGGERTYVVDRIEDDLAVLVADEGGQITVPRDRLPRGAREGAVLRVPRDEHGRPDWASARLDPAEAARRRREAEETLRKLGRRDPGGDVDL